MIRQITSNPWPLAGLILAQAACAGFFVWDVILDSGELTGLFPINVHFVIEAGAVLGLIAGIAVEIRVLLRLLARKAHLERQVTMAQSALHDVIKAHFEAWGLTAAEADVAWFTVKGLTITEISQMRGSAEGTVKSHLNAIYRKADVTNRGALLALLIDDLMDGTRPDAPAAA